MQTSFAWLPWVAFYAWRTFYIWKVRLYVVAGPQSKRVIRKAHLLQTNVSINVSTVLWYILRNCNNVHKVMPVHVHTICIHVHVHVHEGTVLAKTSNMAQIYCMSRYMYDLRRSMSKATNVLHELYMTIMFYQWLFYSLTIYTVMRTYSGHDNTFNVLENLLKLFWLFRGMVGYQLLQVACNR